MYIGLFSRSLLPTSAYCISRGALVEVCDFKETMEERVQHALQHTLQHTLQHALRHILHRSAIREHRSWEMPRTQASQSRELDHSYLRIHSQTLSTNWLLRTRSSLQVPAHGNPIPRTRNILISRTRSHELTLTNAINSAHRSLVSHCS